MTELKGHIYHKRRKWRCPKCNRVKMQKPGPHKKTGGKTAGAT